MPQELEQKIEEEEEKIEEAANAADIVQFRPAAMTTTKKASPDSKTGGMVRFSIAGGEEQRESFVRFDLSSLDEDATVDRASLQLNLVEHDMGSYEKDSFKVHVDVLPHGGTWKEGEVSWNDGIEEREAEFVDSFEVDVSGSHDGRRLASSMTMYELDVTDVVNDVGIGTHDREYARITFKLYTDEESGRIDFAGKTFNGGNDVPQLVLTLAE